MKWHGLIMLLASGCAHRGSGVDRSPASLTALEGTDQSVPVVVTESVDSCGEHERRHVELVYVPTGATAWRADGWSTVVGRLGSGEVLVSNEDTSPSTALELAVVTFGGRVTGRCAVSTPFAASVVSWRVRGPGALAGTVPEKHSQTGVRPPEPPEPFGVEVSFGSWGCEVTLAPPSSGGVAAPSVNVFGRTVADVRLDGANFTDATTLVGTRNGREVWRKVIGVARPECKLASTD